MVGALMDSDEHYPVEVRISFSLSLERDVPSADILCPSLLMKGTGGPLGTGSVAAPAQCSLIKVGEMSWRGRNPARLAGKAAVFCTSR